MNVREKYELFKRETLKIQDMPAVAESMNIRMMDASMDNVVRNLDICNLERVIKWYAEFADFANDLRGESIRLMDKGLITTGEMLRVQEKTRQLVNELLPDEVATKLVDACGCRNE